MYRGWQQKCCMIVTGLVFVWLTGGCASREGESIPLKEVSALEAAGEASQETGAAESLDEKREDGLEAGGYSDEQEEAVTEVIYVYVCGQVYAPGVYELAHDSRLYEAIEAAQGMTESAAASYLNQAEKLSDGQKVYVPSVEEAGIAGNMQTDMPEDDGKVNLNTAAKEELMTLSGIGEVKAQAIIQYRQERGGFTDIGQLKEVEGIKDGVYDKIKEQVRI